MNQSRRILKNEFQLINLDAVTTMATLNGQTFANAFANVYTELNQGSRLKLNHSLKAHSLPQAALQP